MTQSPPTEPGPEAIYGDLFEGTPYRVIRRLGAGGMGEVFLVEHRELGRELVLKALHPRYSKDPRFLQRLRIEAQVLGLLKHGNIVAIVGVDQLRDGRSCIVMEFLTGHSLADEIRARAPLPVLDAVTFACELLSALDAAHSKGIVHRDVKPDNLFVCERPDGTRYLKVLDFGVARVLPESDSVRPMPAEYRTQTGMVVGTPRYLSPEGAMGHRVDARADVYAAALVLYTMLVGRGPFDHVDEEAMLLTAHAVEDPEPPSRLSNSPIPPELDEAILRALAKEPAKRFQSASEFREALLRIVELLTRPSGWAQTSAFSISDVAAPDSARESVRSAEATAPLAAAAIEPRSERPMPSDEPIGDALPSANEDPVSGLSRASLTPVPIRKPGTPLGRAIVLFLIGAVTMGTLAVQLVFWVRGIR